MSEKYQVRGPGTGATVVTGANLARLVAALDQMVIDVRDLKNISLYMVQDVDAGTVTLKFEKSPDGVVWVAVGATKSEADFAAGQGAAIEFTLSDTNGMPLECEQVRITATALAGGGAYYMLAAGNQKPEYR